MSESPPPLQGLAGADLRHPLDQATFLALQRKIEEVPTLKNVMTALVEEVEEESHLINLADNTRLGQNQLPEIHGALARAAASLGTNTPVLFLDTNPHLNAWAIGRERPIVGVTNSLVDGLSERELTAVFGHEIGHILCDHTFLRLVASHYEAFASLAGLIPLVGPAAAFAIRLPLFTWYRASELSADRASLLVCRDVETVIRMIARLAGTTGARPLSVDALMVQAEDFEKLAKDRKERDSVWGKIGVLLSDFALLSATSTHPWPAVRIREILNWSKSEECALLFKGDLERVRALKAKQIAETAPAAPVTGHVLTDTAKSVKDWFKRKS